MLKSSRRTWSTADDTLSTVSTEVTFITDADESLWSDVRVTDGAVIEVQSVVPFSDDKIFMQDAPFTVTLLTKTSDG